MLLCLHFNVRMSMTTMFHNIFMDSLNHIACMLSCFNHVQLFMTSWTVTHQAPLSMGFSRQEYWSELSCPPPEDLPKLRIKPMFLVSPALGSRFFTTGNTWPLFIFNFVPFVLESDSKHHHQDLCEGN